MVKDIRKEQLALLRFEKRLTALAVIAAAGASSAASAGTHLGSDVAMRAFDDIQNALINLADVTTGAHSALEENARALGLRALEASGGLPKGEPAVVIRSIFGL